MGHLKLICFMSNSIQSVICSIHRLTYTQMKSINTLLFISTWWLNDIGLLWFIIWSYWIGLDNQLKGYNSIIIYARLTHKNLFLVPFQFHFVATISVHIIFFFVYWGVYNMNKKKIILFGTLLISIIPNYYNPYEIGNIRLGIRLLLYCFCFSGFTDLQCLCTCVWALRCGSSNDTARAQDGYTKRFSRKQAHK